MIFSFGYQWGAIIIETVTLIKNDCGKNRPFSSTDQLPVYNLESKMLTWVKEKNLGKWFCFLSPENADFNEKTSNVTHTPNSIENCRKF